MDPEHRHELKESDLERFARNFGPWWQKHGTTVLLVIALGLLTFVVVRYLSTRADRARENAYAALAEATNPAAKHEVALEYQNVPGLSARAWLEAADMKLQEALVGPPGGQQGLGGGQQSLSPEERKEGLEKAARFYERVVDRAESPLLVINARLGLAAAHESLGRFEKAREQYETVRKEAEGQYPELADQARSRLADLDRISEPIEFPDPPASAGDSGGGPLQGGSLPANLLDLPGSGGQPASGSGGEGGDGLLEIPAAPQQQQEDMEPGAAPEEAPSGSGSGATEPGSEGQSDAPQEDGGAEQQQQPAEGSQDEPQQDGAEQQQQQ